MRQRTSGQMPKKFGYGGRHGVLAIGTVCCWGRKERGLEVDVRHTMALCGLALHEGHCLG